MGFKFGAKSIQNMEGVHPQLVHAAHFALHNSDVDFGFFEGVRSLEQEKVNISNGTSHLSSPIYCMHCPQDDGFGHAMDLVPYIEGKYDWDWGACIKIAKLIQQYAFQNDLTIRWGGVWDIPLNKLSINLGNEVSAYKVRYKKRTNHEAFLDGVHFELPLTNNTSDDAKETTIIA